MRSVLTAYLSIAIKAMDSLRKGKGPKRNKRSPTATNPGQLAHLLVLMRMPLSALPMDTYPVVDSHTREPTI